MMESPVAARIPVVRSMHGDTFTDDYAWMKDPARTAPEVLAHIEAENAYTNAVMQHTEPLQQKLYDEILARIKQTDTSAPDRDGDYLYTTRVVEGLQYPIHCRHHADGPEEILLDENELAAGHDHFQLGAHRPSPDHRLLAYSTATKGAEEFEIAVRDIATGTHLAERISGASYDVLWCNDNTTLYYRTMDAAHREYRLWRHRLGTDPADDELIFEEPDPGFTLNFSRARSGRYILFSLDSMTTNEAWFLDGDDPAAAPQLVRKRAPGVEYDVEHQGERFLIRTNENAKNFRVMQAPVTAPSAWEELIPHRPDVTIAAVDAFAHHLVLSEREHGLPKLRIIDVQNGDSHDITQPEPTYDVGLGTNATYDTTVMRFTYESIVTPPSWIDYDMRTRARTVVKEQDVLGGFDRSRYVVQRRWARAPDGVEVPISLAYRSDLQMDGSAPLWLTGYGSYGASSDPWFTSDRIGLLDRGFTFAIAHVRGGGELGEEWRDAGRLTHKQNTFTDFIACAEELIAAGFTSPGRIVANGGSAGGLLMGVIANQRPDLFGAVIAEVPFVDVINTISDPALLFTVMEYEEWGNPADEAAYRTMRAYSPYENVRAQRYPRILATAGLWDPRVNFWEPAKWVARLRELRTDDGDTLLKTRMVAGHFGTSGRYNRVRDVAFNHAFALDTLGLHTLKAPV